MRNEGSPNVTGDTEAVKAILGDVAQSHCPDDGVIFVSKRNAARRWLSSVPNVVRRSPMVIIIPVILMLLCVGLGVYGALQVGGAVHVAWMYAIWSSIDAIDFQGPL